MSDIIHLLPDNIANQIAAGEVIQRPASVVKELVENSVDAGASRIEVNIKDAGKTLIQVIDNGKGMSETDARMAFERHATSKISKAEDLFSLKTMGFRGEALASIAAVACVDLRTRLKGEEIGNRVSIEGSAVKSVEADSCSEGSIFSVKNLFFNVPARRKFLKSNETEFRNILAEFERIALVNPSISFALYHNGTEVFNLPSSNIRQRILDIYGKNINSKLLSVEAESSLVSISGFVGCPDSAKKRGFLQYFFVNGRYMKHPYFHKAIMQAYENLIPAGYQPNYFVYFQLNPSSIDVNIHPTKTEIKFENEQPIWQILMSAIRETLAKSSSIPLIDFDMEGALDIPVYNMSKTQPSTVDGMQRPALGYNPFEAIKSDSYKKPDFDWDKLYQNFENEQGNADEVMSFVPEGSTVGSYSEVPSSIGTVEVPADNTFFQEMQLRCFQYKGGYIVAQLPDGIAIVEQNRAHVRALYDQYMERLKKRRSLSQQLLFPEIVEFTQTEVTAVESLSEDLHAAGFELSNLGNGSYALNSVPAGLENADTVSLLKEIVYKYIELGNKAHDGICSIIAFSMARAAAISVGKLLSAEEMEHLLSSLLACKDYHLTPDGKKIMIYLSEEEIEKRLK